MLQANGKRTLTDRLLEAAGGQGQSGQAITLFQITPYVSDFQTLNNPGSWQPVGASKNYFYLPFFDTSLSSLMMWKFRIKESDILGGKHTLTPPTYFQGLKTPNPQDLCHPGNKPTQTQT